MYLLNWNRQFHSYKKTFNRHLFSVKVQTQRSNELVFFCQTLKMTHIMCVIKHRGGGIDKHNSCIGKDSNIFIHHIPFAECFFMGRAQKKSIIFCNRKEFIWTFDTHLQCFHLKMDSYQATHPPTLPFLFEVEEKPEETGIICLIHLLLLTKNKYH